MAEYIECRNCDSPYCDGCNIHSLATMLRNGKLECLMDNNRSINCSADVVSFATFEQTKWERDTALQTLYEHGIGLAQKVDMGEVVYGYWDGIEVKDTCSVCGNRISDIFDADSYIRIEVMSELIACPFCGARNVVR